MDRPPNFWSKGRPPEFSLEAASSKPQEKSRLDSSPRAQDLRAQDLRAQDLRAQDLRAQDLRTQDLRAQDLRAQDLRAQDLRTQDLRTQDLRTQDLRTQDLRTQDLRTQDLRAQDLRTQDLRAQDLRTQDLRTQDLRAQDLRATQEEELQKLLQDHKRRLISRCGSVAEGTEGAGSTPLNSIFTELYITEGLSDTTAQHEEQRLRELSKKTAQHEEQRLRELSKKTAQHEEQRLRELSKKTAQHEEQRLRELSKKTAQHEEQRLRELSKKTAQHEEQRLRELSKKTVQETSIRCQDIFKALPTEEQQGAPQSIRAVLTCGVAGVGKTFSVLKFCLDWAQGSENQELELVVPLSFREMNLVKGQRYSLMQLIQVFHPALEKQTLSPHSLSVSKLLFILDGLDESRLDLDFDCELISEEGSVV
uniref:FISNA domain-containing protein n=1 Tax=Knipowitschia caucasica TaxID=637954 RepID=A0AAV2KI61_KNICA